MIATEVHQRDELFVNGNVDAVESLAIGVNYSFQSCCLILKFSEQRATDRKWVERIAKAEQNLGQAVALPATTVVRCSQPPVPEEENGVAALGHESASVGRE